MDLTCPPPVLFHEMSPLAPTLPPYGQSASVHACVFVCMNARVCCMSRVVLTSHIYKEWRDDEQNSFHGNCWHRVMKKKGGGGWERIEERQNRQSGGFLLFVCLIVCFPHSTPAHSCLQSGTKTATMNMHSRYTAQDDDHTITHLLSERKEDSHHAQHLLCPAFWSIADVKCLWIQLLSCTMICVQSHTCSLFLAETASSSLWASHNLDLFLCRLFSAHPRADTHHVCYRDISYVQATIMLLCPGKL